MPIPGVPIDQDETPVPIRQYQFYGVDVAPKRGSDEAEGNCPFCKRERKLFVNEGTGQFHCKTCGEKGNIYSFMRSLWEASDFPEAEGQLLAENRGVSPASLEAWGLRYSFISGEWLVPAYDAGGKLNQLYRRIHNQRENRWYLNPPKGTNHQLHGVNLFDRSKRDIYLCEGVWDAIALWELMRQVKVDEEGTYSITSNVDISLLRDANVLATPSCTVFSEYWLSLFAGRRVFILFDNDHPAKQNNKSGAFEGIKRVTSILATMNEPPESIHYLNWSDGETETGEHWNLDLKHGYDLRDLLTGHATKKDAAEALGWMVDHTKPAKAEWVNGADGKKGRVVVEPLPCDNWKTVLGAWEKAMHMHEGLIQGFAVMLAAACSVDIGLDQLWVKFIGPPSCGKTTFADGLLIDRKHTTLKSIISGLHSGYKGKEEEGDEDFSLMAQIKGRAVIIKDGDTLMSADNVTKTLSELRDAYDRKSSTFYKNGVARNYEDHSFVMLVYGTHELRALDKSELGSRLIDCVVLEKIDPAMTSKIQASKRAQRRHIMATQATANGDRLEGEEKVKAKRLTGGYLKYLCDNIKHLLADIKPTDAADDQIEAYAEFVAMFRARPSSTQNEIHSREVGAGRLSDQLGKLAYCLAVVLNKTSFDKEVLHRVRQCALDTARGSTLKIASHLYKSGLKGSDTTSISQRCNIGMVEAKKLLMFMRDIDLVELRQDKTAKVGMGSGKMKWCLTAPVRKLYASVMKD